MDESRRQFLKTSSAVAAAAGILGPFSPSMLEAPPRLRRSPGEPDIRDLSARALDAAKTAGASYADVRLTVGKIRWTDMEDRKVELVRLVNELQFGVRVIVDGAWGFASSREVTADEVVRIARLAVEQAKSNPYGKSKKLELAPAPAVPSGDWETPVKQDTWKKTVDDQLTQQLAASDAVMKTPGTGVFSRFVFYSRDVTYASTEGSYITQRLHDFGGFFYAIVVAADREFTAYRIPESFPGGGYGWEAIEQGASWIAELPAVIAEAKQMAVAKPVDVGRYDLVLDGYAMGIPLAESIGAATELDRALGWEMNARGTSYLAPPDEILGKFSYNNPNLNVKASRLVPQAWGTVKWDEEGVVPDEFSLVEKGIVVDYQTGRQLAMTLADWYRKRAKQPRSHGCMSSQGSNHMPVVLPATFILEPGPRDYGVNELMADVKNGLYFGKAGYASMDPRLLNGEYLPFGGVVYEIKNGKRGDMVRHAAYQARTPDFWKNVDAIGGKSSVVKGDYVLVKGEPAQIIARSAVSPAARVRQINVVNHGRKG